ncbi:MAG: hypothetical protein MJY45_05935 [Bacteroidales bacterium]|nr:hypothetical protein [Bacteroidales bacterium]
MVEPENIGGRSGRLAGNAASFLAYLIFGFNIVFCKDVANSGLVPQTALFCLRMSGAGAESAVRHTRLPLSSHRQEAIVL